MHALSPGWCPESAVFSFSYTIFWQITAESRRDFSKAVGPGAMNTLEELIVREASTLFQQGRYKTLRAWLGRVPPKSMAKNPWLLYWNGMCRMLEDGDSGAESFEQALERFEKEDDLTGTFLALCGMSESLTFSFDTYLFYDWWLEKAAALCRLCPKPPTLEAEVRLTVNMLNGITMRRPGHAEAGKWQKKALALIDRRRGVAPELKLQLLNPLILNRVTAGALAEAKVLLDSYRSLAAQHDMPPMALLVLGNLEALHCWRSAEAKTCLVCVDDALQMAAQTGIGFLTPILLVNGASGALSEGRIRGAEKYFSRIEMQLDGAGAYIKQLYNLLKAWAHIAARQSIQAREYANRSLSFAQFAGNPEATAVSSLAVAITCFLSDDHNGSLGRLEIARNICRGEALRQIDFACRFFKAELAFATGDRGQGIKELQEALEIGRNNDYTTFPLWRPGAVTELCCRALEAGIEIEYVHRLIRCRQLNLISPPVLLERWPWKLRIYCFGRFEVVRQGLPLRPMTKARQKPLALLKLIIALGGRKVPVSRLALELWPDADGDMQMQSFNTTLHRLRKLLNIKDAILLQSGEVTLNNHLCWVDVWCFQRLTGGQAGMLQREDDRPLDAAAMEKAVELYHGPFLAGETFGWAIPLREKLHGKFIGAVEQQGHHLMACGRWEEAARCYLLGIEVDPLIENFYYQLMICHMQRGHEGDALLTYRRCRRLFMSSLGLRPSKTLEALYQKLRSSGP